MIKSHIEIMGALLMMLQEYGYSATTCANGWQIIVESTNQSGPWIVSYLIFTGNVQVCPHHSSRVQEEDTLFILSDPECFEKVCAHLRDRGLEPIKRVQPQNCNF